MHQASTQAPPALPAEPPAAPLGDAAASDAAQIAEAGAIADVEPAVPAVPAPDEALAASAASSETMPATGVSAAAQQEAAKVREVAATKRHRPVAHRPRSPIARYFARAKHDVHTHAVAEQRRLRDAFYGEAGHVTRFNAAAKQAEAALTSVAFAAYQQVGTTVHAHEATISNQTATATTSVATRAARFEHEVAALGDAKKHAYGRREQAHEIAQSIDGVAAEAATVFAEQAVLLQAQLTDDGEALAAHLARNGEALAAGWWPQTSPPDWLLALRRAATEGAEKLAAIYQRGVAALAQKERAELRALAEQEALVQAQWRAQTRRLDAARQRQYAAGVRAAEAAAVAQVLRADRELRRQGAEDGELGLAFAELGISGELGQGLGGLGETMFGASDDASIAPTLQQAVASLAAGANARISGVADAFVAAGGQAMREAEGALRASSVAAETTISQGRDNALKQLATQAETGLASITQRVDAFDRLGQGQGRDAEAAMDDSARALSSTGENLLSEAWDVIKGAAQIVGRFLVGFVGAAWDAFKVIALIVLVVIAVVAILALLGVVGSFLGALAAIAGAVMAVLSSAAVIAALMVLGAIVAVVSILNVIETARREDATKGDVAEASGRALFDVLSMFAPHKIGSALQRISLIRNLAARMALVSEGRAWSSAAATVERVVASPEFAAGFAAGAKRAEAIDHAVAIPSGSILMASPKTVGMPP